MKPLLMCHGSAECIGGVTLVVAKDVNNVPTVSWLRRGRQGTCIADERTWNGHELAMRLQGTRCHAVVEEAQNRKKHNRRTLEASQIVHDWWRKYLDWLLRASSHLSRSHPRGKQRYYVAW
jgi:hypothetical protein